MTNGHGNAHGGFIFSLADSAFAFACNSRNERAVAQACDIVFAAPARLGDRLVATATERHRFGRNGIYDIRVTKDVADGRWSRSSAAAAGPSAASGSRDIDADETEETEETER